MLYFVVTTIMQWPPKTHPRSSRLC